jgi:RNA polymerase sigma factor (sigma-70 family)
MNAPASFPMTRWTRVLAARGGSAEAKTALSELCAAYYEPVHTYLTHTAPGESARDLTHAFFAQLLERGGLTSVQPQRGKFRSYLLGAVKHFIADQRDRDRAEKRGGGIANLSLDAEHDDSSEEHKIELESAAPPDSLYDREWAIALLHRANERLTEEQQEAGREHQFAVLKPWLNGEAGALSQAAAAIELGVTENVVRVAIHRLRKRFGENVRHEIAQTVDNPDEISAELNYLIEALRQR